MDLALFNLAVSKEQDIEALRSKAYLLVKCLLNDSAGEGYCVVNDHNSEYPLYYGNRDNCVAFIEGYNSAPITDVGCFDSSVLCLCVDTPSRTIIVPEDRFGEELSPKKEG